MRISCLVNTKVLNRRCTDIHKPVIILSSDGGNMGGHWTSSVSRYGRKCLKQKETRLSPSGGKTIHTHAHGREDKWEHMESRKNNKPDPRTLTAPTSAAVDKQVVVYRTWCQSKQAKAEADVCCSGDFM